MRRCASTEADPSAALLEPLERRVLLDGAFSTLDGAAVFGARASDGQLVVSTIDLNGNPIVFEHRLRTDDDNGGGDTWALVQRLLAEGGAVGAGDPSIVGHRSIAIHGDRIAIGHPTDAQALPGLPAGAGTVSIFRLNDDTGTWSLQTVLAAPDPAEGEGFGWALDLHGSRLVVGSLAGDAAYVFKNSDDDSNDDDDDNHENGRWKLEGTLLPGADVSDIRFGFSVAIDSGAIIVGAPGAEHLDDDATLASGAVYFFERRSGDWVLAQRVDPPANSPDGEFGHAVALKGSTAIVGAWLDNERAANAGAVYLLDRDRNDWDIIQKILPLSPAEDARFGFAVSARNSRAAATAFNPEGDPDSHYALVLKRRANEWSIEATLSPASDEAGELFGSSIDLHGGRIVVGSLTADGPGAAVVYHKIGDAWLRETRLILPSGDSTSAAGFAVALHGNTLVLAGFEDTGDDLATPAAWVFRGPAHDDDDGPRRIWIVRNLHDLTASPDPIGNVRVWTDPKDGLVYAAMPTEAGVILFQRSPDQAEWTARNLTAEIMGATPIVESMTVFATTDGLVHISGLSAQGDLVLYRQTAGSGGAEWEYISLSTDHLAPQGQTTPAFAGALTAYVTAWNGLNIAGVDEHGVMHVVWTAPGMALWRTDNLSAITDAPTMHGDLTVFLTPWNGINIAGLDDAGNLHVTWWVPAFHGEWVNSNFNALFEGPALEPGTLTSYTTPWGGLNITGADSRGEPVVYWWTPDFAEDPDTDAWRANNLADEVDEGELPAGPLHGFVTPEGQINIFGANEMNDAIRYYWEPGRSWRTENLTHEAEPA